MTSINATTVKVSKLLAIGVSILIGTGAASAQSVLPTDPSARLIGTSSHLGDVVEQQGPTAGETTALPQAAVPTNTPKPPANTPKPANQKVITLAPVTAFYSQATIDRGKLVTWMTEPVCLIAGHDSMGWNWLDDIATGRTVKVTTGPCAGTYRVSDHRHQSAKGGPAPAWMSDPGIDLVLQTCTGSSGMGFSLAVRI